MRKLKVSPRPIQKKGEQISAPRFELRIQNLSLRSGLSATTLALNEVEGDVAHVDWSIHGDALVERGPFELVLAADVLYTKANVEAAAALFPKLVKPGGTLLVADPNRAGAQHFLNRFEHTTRSGPDVSLHTVRFDGRSVGHT